MDEVYIVTARSDRRYLWRAVDQDGDVLDMLIQKRKDMQAAVRLFKKLMKAQGRSARKLITDKLPVIVQREKQSCSPQCIAVIVMRIIVPKYRMSIRERRNDRCADLSQPARHSDF